MKENKKENKNKISTGEKMKIKEKVMEYFQTYWRRNRFMKVVSLVVLVCFMVNIIQPATAFASEDDLKNKRHASQDMVSGAVAPGIASPVNQQVDFGAAELPKEVKMEMSKQNITVNQFGNVIEQAKGANKPIGNIDEKGKVTATFDNSGKADKDEKKNEELQSRVNQFFEEGGVRGGGYKTTVSSEFRTENRQDVKDMEGEAEQKAQERVEGMQAEQRAEETGKMEGDIAVESKIEETVQSEKKEIVKGQNVNEQSVSEKKDNLQKALAKKKESTSVTVATIAKVQETGEERGKELIAVRNTQEGRDQIAMYQNENGTDNIYVGMSEGLMVYANHSGSVNVQEYASEVEMEGNEYKKTGISLILGSKEEEDGGINKRIEGLFAIETLEMVTKEGLFVAEAPEVGVSIGSRVGEGIEKLNKVLQSMGEEISDKRAEIREGAVQEIVLVVNKISRSVLAMQPIVADIAIKGEYRRTTEKTELKADSNRVSDVLGSYAKAENASERRGRVSDTGVSAALSRDAKPSVSRPTTVETKPVAAAASSERSATTARPQTENKTDTRAVRDEKKESAIAAKKLTTIGLFKRNSYEREVTNLAKEAGMSVRELNTFLGTGKKGFFSVLFGRDKVSLRDVVAIVRMAKDEGISVKDAFKIMSNAKKEGISLSEVKRSFAQNRGNLKEFVAITKTAQADGVSLRDTLKVVRVSNRDGVNARELLGVIGKCKEEGVNFGGIVAALNQGARTSVSLIGRLVRASIGGESLSVNMRDFVDAVNSGMSVKESVGTQKNRMGAVGTVVTQQNIMRAVGIVGANAGFRYIGNRFVVGTALTATAKKFGVRFAVGKQAQKKTFSANVAGFKAKREFVEGKGIFSKIGAKHFGVFRSVKTVGFGEFSKKMYGRKGVGIFGSIRQMFVKVKENIKAKKETRSGNKTKSDAKSDGESDGEDAKYNGHDKDIVQTLAKDTGRSEKEVVAELDKAREQAKQVDIENGLPEGTTFNKSMAVLKDALSKGSSILNCASEALYNWMGGTVGEGLLALQALCIEIGSGNFNEDSFLADGQLQTSMEAQKQVLSGHGVNSDGYGVNIEDFVNGMNAGDKAIVWVNANHFITITKNDDGTFDVLDPNKNNGKALTYEGGELGKLLSGDIAKTTTGESVQGYEKVVDANGQMKVLTDSKGVSEKGTKLGVTDLKNIRGAKKGGVFGKGGLFDKAGKAIGKAIKSVGKTIGNIVKGVGKIVYGVVKLIGNIATAAFHFATFQWDKAWNDVRRIGSNVTEIIQGVGQVVAGALQTVGAITNQVLGFIGGLIGGSFGDAISKIGQSIEKNFDRAADFVTKTFDAIGKFVGSAIQCVANIIEGFGKILFYAVQGEWDKCGEAFAQFWTDGVYKLVFGAVELIGDLAKEIMLYGIDLAFQGVENILLGLGAVAGTLGLDSWQKGLSQAYDDVHKASQDTQKFVEKVHKFVWDIVTDLLHSVIQGNGISLGFFRFGYDRQSGGWSYGFTLGIQLGGEDENGQYRGLFRLGYSYDYNTKTGKSWNVGINLNVGGVVALNCSYGESDLYGVQMNFGIKATIYGITIGVSARYQEKDPFNTYSNGWTLGAEVGFCGVTIGVSYNTKYGTVGLSVGYGKVRVSASYNPTMKVMTFGVGVDTGYGIVGANFSYDFKNDMATFGVTYTGGSYGTIKDKDGKVTGGQEMMGMRGDTNGAGKFTDANGKVDHMKNYMNGLNAGVNVTWNTKTGETKTTTYASKQNNVSIGSIAKALGGDRAGIAANNWESKYMSGGFFNLGALGSKADDVSLDNTIKVVDGDKTTLYSKNTDGSQGDVLGSIIHIPDAVDPTNSMTYLNNAGGLQVATINGLNSSQMAGLATAFGAGGILGATNYGVLQNNCGGITYYQPVINENGKVENVETGRISNIKTNGRVSEFDMKASGGSEIASIFGVNGDTVNTIVMDNAGAAYSYMNFVAHVYEKGEGAPTTQKLGSQSLLGMLGIVKRDTISSSLGNHTRTVGSTFVENNGLFESVIIAVDFDRETGSPKSGEMIYSRGQGNLSIDSYDFRPMTADELKGAAKSNEATNERDPRTGKPVTSKSDSENQKAINKQGGKSGGLDPMSAFRNLIDAGSSIEVSGKSYEAGQKSYAMNTQSNTPTRYTYSATTQMVSKTTTNDDGSTVTVRGILENGHAFDKDNAVFKDNKKTIARTDEIKGIERNVTFDSTDLLGWNYDMSKDVSGVETQIKTIKDGNGNVVNTIETSAKVTISGNWNTVSAENKITRNERDKNGNLTHNDTYTNIPVTKDESGIFSSDYSKANRDWVDYGKDATVMRYGGNYKNRSNIEMQGSKDTITLSKDVNYTCELINGKYVMTSGDNTVTGTYNNYKEDGTLQGQGSLENCRFEMGSNGYPSLEGKININDGNLLILETAKGTGKGGGNGGNSKSDTNAVINQRTDGKIEVSDGSVSLRNGALSAIEEGAVAKAGSVLGGIGGHVKTLDGPYTLSGGQWKAATMGEDGKLIPNNASFEYLDSEAAKNSVAQQYIEDGYKLNAQDMAGLSAKGAMKGDIPATAGQALQGMLSNSNTKTGTTQEKSVRAAVISDNMFVDSVIKLDKGANVVFQLDEGGSLGIFATSEILTTATLPAALKTIDGADSVNLKFDAKDRITLGTGIYKYDLSTEGSKQVLTNTASVKFAGMGDVVFNEGEIQISSDSKSGKLIATFGNDENKLTYVDGSNNSMKLISAEINIGSDSVSFVNFDFKASGRINNPATAAAGTPSANAAAASDEQQQQTAGGSGSASKEQTSGNVVFSGKTEKEDGGKGWSVDGVITISGELMNEKGGLEKVFTRDNIFSVGSSFTQGSDVYKLNGKVTSGIIKIDAIDANGNMFFVSGSDKATVSMDNGVTAIYDKNGITLAHSEYRSLKGNVGGDKERTWKTGEARDVYATTEVTFNGKKYSVLARNAAGDLVVKGQQYKNASYTHNLSGKATGAKDANGNAIMYDAGTSRLVKLDANGNMKSVTFSGSFKSDGMTYTIGGAKGDVVKVTMDGKSFDVTTEQGKNDFKNAVNFKNEEAYAGKIASQFSDIYGAKNITVSGSTIKINMGADDIREFDTKNKSSMDNLVKFANNKQITDVLNQQYVAKGEVIARDKHGYAIGVVKRSDLHDGKGWFNDTNNDRTVIVDGKEYKIDEDHVNKSVNLQGNGKLQITEDTSSFLSFNRDVSVTDYTFNIDGSVTVANASTSKTAWLYSSGTKSSVTVYGSAESMNNNDSGKIINSNESDWTLFSSRAGKLADFGKGDLEGSYQFNDNTLLTANRNTIKAENGKYDGLSDGMYNTSTMSITDSANPKNSTVIETVSSGYGRHDQAVMATSVYNTTLKDGYNAKDLSGTIKGSFDVNADVKMSQSVYSLEGQLLNSGTYSGEGYFSNGSLHAYNVSGEKTDALTGISYDASFGDRKDSYSVVRMDEIAGVYGYDKCAVLPGSGIGGKFDGNDLNEMIVFQNKGWFGYSETVVLNPNSDKKYSSSELLWKTPVIRADGNMRVGDVTDALRIEINKDSSVKISLSEQTMIMDSYTTHEGHYVRPVYSIKETQQSNISYGKDGSITVASNEAQRGTDGKLNDRVKQSEIVTNMNSNRTVKELNFDYDNDGVYDKKQFINPKNMFNIDGSSIGYDKSGSKISHETISGSIVDIKWNGDDQILQSTKKDYTETTYAKRSDTVDGPALVSGDDAASQEWVKTGKTVQNGTTYFAYREKDLRNVPNSHGAVFTDDVESFTLNDGIVKQEYKTQQIDGIYSDVLVSQEKITTATLTNKTTYSVNGVSYVALDDIDGAAAYSSRSSTVHLMSKTEKADVVNGKVVEGKTTTVTQSNPYEERTTNYYGGTSYKTVMINGEAKQVASITSETEMLTPGLGGRAYITQNTVRSESDGEPESKAVITSGHDIVNYNKTSYTYSDGSTKVDFTAQQETFKDTTKKPNGISTTETQIKEMTMTDAKGNVSIVRHAASATETDMETDKIVKEMSDLSTNTSINISMDMSKKEVYREIGKTTAYDTYTDKKTGTVTNITTVSENSKSIENFENGKLVRTWQDTGNFTKTADSIDITEIQKDANGKESSIVTEGKNVVIASGREISEEKFGYINAAGKTTEQPATSTYERTAYDYLDNSMSNTKGSKTFTYGEMKEDGKAADVVKTTDLYESLTYGLTADLNPGVLKKHEKGYTVEYDIATTKDSYGNTTRTSKSDQYKQTADYASNRYTVTSNTGIDSTAKIDNAGKVISKNISGNLTTWKFNSAKEALGINLDSVVRSGNTGGKGTIDHQQTYSYSNSGYSYDYMNRETGYDFTRTYPIDADGKNHPTTYSGKSTTEYTQTYVKDDKGNIQTVNGMPLVSTSYKSEAVTIVNGKEKVLDGSGGYYGTPTVGNTSIYKSIESSDIMNTSLGNIAGDMLSNTQLRKDFAGIQMAEAIDDIKIVAGVFVAAIAVVTTIASFGSASAFWAAVLGAGTAATVAATVTVAALAAIGAAQAFKYTTAAVDCAFEGSWAGFAMNTLLALTSAIGGAQILKGVGSLATALTSTGLKAALKEIGKVALKRAAVGAVIGTTATTAFVAYDNYANDRSWDFGRDGGRILMGALAGGLAGALTTNIGKTMGRMAIIREGSELTKAVFQNFKFANTAINFGKNMFLAGNTLKFAGSKIINESGFDMQDKIFMTKIFNSSVDVYMFMSSASGIFSGKAMNADIIKNLKFSEGALNYGLLGNISQYGFKNAANIFRMSATNGAKAFGSGFVNTFKGAGNALRHPIQTIKGMGGSIQSGWNYARNTTLTNRGLVGATIGGGTLGGGSLVYQMITADGSFGERFDSVNWAAVGGLALAGVMLGGGIGNLAATGGTIKNDAKIMENFRVAYEGTLKTLATNMRPTNLFVRNTEMISRIMSFRMITTGVGAVLDRVTGGDGAGNFGWSTAILDGTIGIVDSAMAEMGVGLDLVGSIKRLSAGGLSLENMNKFSFDTASTMTSPEMWMFGIATGIAQPLFGPILVNSPVIGTLLKPITSMGNKINNQTLSMAYEEGFQEGISGLFGKLMFGDSQAGEIFQELFDKTPDMNLVNLTLTSRGNVNETSIINSRNEINRARQQLEQTLRNNGVDTSTLGSNVNISDFITNNLGTLGLSSQQVSTIQSGYESYTGTVTSTLRTLGISNEILTNSVYNGITNNTLMVEAVLANAANSGVNVSNEDMRNIINNANTGKNSNENINNMYAAAVMNGQPMTQSKMDELMKSDSGMMVLASYIEGIPSNNVQAINNIVSIVEAAFNSSTVNDMNTSQLIQAQVVLSQLSIATREARIDNKTKAALNSQLTTALTIVQNNIVDANIKELISSKPMQDILNQQDLSKYSAAEIAYYTALNGLISRVGSTDVNVNPLTHQEFRMIISTNNSDFWVQRPSGTRGDQLKTDRNNIRTLAEAVFSESIRNAETAINSESKTGKANIEILSQMRLENNMLENMSRYSVTDMIANSEVRSTENIKKQIKFRETLAAEGMFNDGNAVINLIRNFNANDKSVESVAARQRIGAYLMSFADMAGLNTQISALSASTDKADIEKATALKEIRTMISELNEGTKTLDKTNLDVLAGYVNSSVAQTKAKYETMDSKSAEALKLNCDIEIMILYSDILNAKSGTRNISKQIEAQTETAFKARQVYQKAHLENVKKEHINDADNIISNQVDMLLENINDESAIFNNLSAINKIKNLTSLSAAVQADSSIAILDTIRQQHNRADIVEMDGRLRNLEAQYKDAQNTNNQTQSEVLLKNIEQLKNAIAVNSSLNALIDTLQSSEYVKNSTRESYVKQTLDFMNAMRDSYWSKLTNDTAPVSVDGKTLTINQLVTELVKKFDGDKKTLVENITSAEAQVLRDIICEKVYGKPEAKLNFVEKLALDLRLGAESLNNSDATIKVSSFLDAKGKTANQIEMLVNNLLGRVSALETAGGKSFVFIYTASMYAHLTGNPSITEFLGAKSGDAAQIVIHKNNTPLSKALGLEVVSGEECYASQRYDDLAGYYNTASLEEGSKGRIISYSLGTRGFVELTARMSNEKLHEALNNTNLRIADEADVAALSRVAFIQGSGDTHASEALVNHIENIMGRMGNIRYESNVDAAKIAAIESNTTDLIYAFAGDKLVVSEALRQLRDKLSTDIAQEQGKNRAKEKFTNKEEINARFDNILRAKFAMEVGTSGGEKVVFINGGVGTVESGTLGSNTTDQSAAYNVALILMELNNIKNGKSDNTADLNRDKIKLSESMGESTISQIFSRGQGKTLNCGGSATLDVAREIAHTIFGGEAVSIQASTVRRVAALLGDRFEINQENTRDNIIYANVDLAANFLRNRAAFENLVSQNADITAKDSKLNKLKTDREALEAKGESIETVKEQIDTYNKERYKIVKPMADKLGVKINLEGSMAGLLLGAIDMSYIQDTMVETMRQLLNNDNDKAAYDNFVRSVSGLQFNAMMEAILNRFDSLKDYKTFVQGVDAVMAETKPQSVVDQAGKVGQLTFSNESSLRGIDYQSLDISILDGHNFSESDLLQALGRSGRDKDRYTEFAKYVFISKSDMVENLEKAKGIDQWFSNNSEGAKRLFGNAALTNADATKTTLTNNFESYLANNDSLQPWEIVELSTRFRSLQAKSESVLFKANNEAMYILVKEPIAELGRKARAMGSPDAAFLEEMFVKVITHAESELLAKVMMSDKAELASPEQLIKETFMQAINTAERYLNETLAGLSDQTLMNDILWRLVDLKAVDYAGLSQQLQENNEVFDSATFARASRDAYGGLASPAADVAKVLVRLSAQVLPGNSSDASSKPVTLRDAVEQSGLQGEQAKEFENNLINNGLVFEGNGGTPMLTAKGQLYMKVYNGDDDWAKFFAWLFGTLGVEISAKDGKSTDDKHSKAKEITNTLWKAGYTDTKAIDLLKDMYPLINNANVSQKELAGILSAGTHPQGMEAFAHNKKAALPSRTAMAVASAMSGKFDKGSEMYNYFNAISANYKDAVDKYNTFIVSQERGNSITAAVTSWRAGRAVSKLNKNTNMTLDSVKDKGIDQIKAYASMYGVNLEKSESSIDAYQWLKENAAKDMPAIINGINLGDIGNFSRLVSYVSLAKEGIIEKGEPKDMNDILKGKATIKSIVDYGVQEELIKILGENYASKNLSMKEISTMFEDFDKTAMSNENKLIALAILMPSKDSKAMFERYNSLASDKYDLNMFALTDLSDNKMFTKENIPSDALKNMYARQIKGMSYAQYNKSVASRKAKYSELASVDGAGYNRAKSNAQDITYKYGGSSEAKSFVDNLSVGALTDNKFAKAVRDLTKSETDGGVNVKAGKLFSDSELPQVINKIYSGEASAEDKIIAMQEYVISKHGSSVQQKALVAKISERDESKKAASVKDVVKERIPVISSIDANTNSEKGIIGNCLVMSLNATGLVRNDKIAEVSTEFAKSLSKDYGNRVDNLIAAGAIEGDVTAAKVGAAREYGDMAAGVITDESIKNGKIKIGTAGITVINEKAQHAKTLKAYAENEMYLVTDQGKEERKTLRELVDEGYTIILSDQKTMDINKGIVNEVLPSKTKAILDTVTAKFTNSEAHQAGKKLLEKIVDGYASAQDTDRVMLITIASFKDVKEMEVYMGLKKGYTKEDVAAAFINKTGESLYLEQQRNLTVAERDLEISVARVVTDILMASIDNAKIDGMIQSIKSKEGVDALQSILPRERKVNKYIIADAMMQTIVLKDNSIMGMGEFEIDLSEIKTALESKDTKYNMFNNKNDTELLNMIATGIRGQQSLMLPLNLNHIQAVAAAA